MKHHVISFVCNPIGYALNAILSVLSYLPKILDELLEPPVVVLHKFLHRRDDPIQRDPLF